MRKMILIFLLVLTANSMVFAQHVLRSELNGFRADDVLYKQQVDYKAPGRTGANVLWDFSHLEAVDDEYELRNDKINYE